MPMPVPHVPGPEYYSVVGCRVRIENYALCNFCDLVRYFGESQPLRD